MYKKLSSRTSGLFAGLIECWKDIQGYEGAYQVSSFGRVKSMARYRYGRDSCLVPMQEKIMSLKTNKQGYQVIGLHSVSKKFFSVHRLVASAFIPNSDNKETVNHIDGVKKNNNVNNLEWSTHTEQMKHAVDNDLLEVRGSPKFSKTFKQSVLEYHNTNPDVSIFQLSKLFNMSERTAGRIVNEGVKPRTTTRILKSGTTIVEDILTKEQVSEIKALREKGWTLSAIGNKFNRGTSQIHRIVHNKTRTTDIE